MKVNRQPTGRCVLLIMALIGTSLSCTEPTRRHAAFNGSVDTNTIVRFFYQPPLSHPHPPFILRAVDDRDPRLDTAPFQVEGLAAYISLAEMRKVVQILNDSIPSWDTSKDVEGPRPPMDLPFPNGLEITVYFSTGTAQTVITPGELCATLAPLDAALRNRALWEFQFFRGDYGCNVPGFDVKKYYKEHFTGERQAK
jgi:hypothetical protein